MAVPFDVRLHHPQPPQAPARAAKCERHPEQPFTGFCSSCLRERLAGLEPAAHRHLKLSPSLFSQAPDHKSAVSSSSSILPELRRCRSLSGAGGAPPAAAMEPKRRSCDVRSRSTLWSLFYLDEEPIGCSNRRSSAARGETDIESRNLGFAAPLPEEEDEDEQEEEDFRDADEIITQAGIQVSGIGGEIREELSGDGLRPMKDHIYLESKSKGPAKGAMDFGGSFWLAASVFSKKLQKWRGKQVAKKGAGIRVEKSSSKSHRLFGETHPELYENIPGRLSLDVGRISIDRPRYSLDEARASWDGYGYTARSSCRHLPLRQPSTISVGEQIFHRSDAQIPVEEEHSSVPGGTAQTREYYSETLPHRRRRSLDRSSSVRRSSVDGTEDLPLKPPSISRISPTLHEYFHHVQASEREEPSCNRAKPERSGLWSKGWNLWSLIQHRREPGRSFPGEYPDKKQAQEGLCGSRSRSSSSGVGSMCSTDCRKDKEKKKNTVRDWSEGTHSLANDLLRLY